MHIYPVIYLESGTSESWDSPNLKYVSPRHRRMSATTWTLSSTPIKVYEYCTKPMNCYPFIRGILTFNAGYKMSAWPLVFRYNLSVLYVAVACDLQCRLGHAVTIGVFANFSCSFSSITSERHGKISSEVV